VQTIPIQFKMEFNEIKTKQKVYDFWYPDKGSGFVLKKTKSTVTVFFEDMDVWKYDKAHVKFLLPEGR